ncbi:MAG: ester cyclase [Bacteroidetes bacterium]|nr:ester cyclase [Bacteroidota bacterium]
MTDLERQNKEIVLRFNREALEQGKIDVVNEIIGEDFVNHTMPGSPKGPQGIIDFITNVLHKGLKNIVVDIHDQVVEGDKVVTRKTIRGVHTDVFMGIKPGGTEVSVQIIDIVTLKDGKYTDHWGLRDIQDVINKSSN